MVLRSLTFAGLILTARSCAPYPPIPPEDPCASDKLVCATFKSDPELTFCGYAVTDDAGDERMTNCPRQTYYVGPDGGKHFVRP